MPIRNLSKHFTKVDKHSVPIDKSSQAGSLPLILMTSQLHIRFIFYLRQKTTLMTKK